MKYVYNRPVEGFILKSKGSVIIDSRLSPTPFLNSIFQCNTYTVYQEVLLCQETIDVYATKTGLGFTIY